MSRIEHVQTREDEGPLPYPDISVEEMRSNALDSVKGNGTQPRDYNEDLEDFNQEPSVKCPTCGN